MPVDVATVGAVFTFIAPLYAGLYHINRQIGSLNVETNVNADDVDDLARTVDDHENRIRAIEG